jgi:hypothetical protein
VGLRQGESQLVAGPKRTALVSLVAVGLGKKRRHVTAAAAAARGRG